MRHCSSSASSTCSIMKANLLLAASCHLLFLVHQDCGSARALWQISPSAATSPAKPRAAEMARQKLGTRADGPLIWLFSAFLRQRTHFAGDNLAISTARGFWVEAWRESKRKGSGEGQMEGWKSKELKQDKTGGRRWGAKAQESGKGRERGRRRDAEEWEGAAG